MIQLFILYSRIKVAPLAVFHTDSLITKDENSKISPYMPQWSGLFSDALKCNVVVVVYLLQAKSGIPNNVPGAPKLTLKTRIIFI